MFRVEFIVTSDQRGAVERVLMGLDSIIRDTAVESRTMIVKQFFLPKTGNLYRKLGRLHRASAPGEPPANETGRLESSMRVIPLEGGYGIKADESIAPYARRLEFGMPGARIRRTPSNKAIELDIAQMEDKPIAPRPFMRTKVPEMSSLFVRNVYNYLVRMLK